MGNHKQIPTVIQMITDIANDMTIAAILGWQQVARPCVMPQRRKGAPHYARILAGN
ncbi:hypothetical protein V6617_10220 [Pelagibacterium nitratireducens]|uniref:Uncharacterized protein n=1 Tax=Pelagibacterium nitratireducens TaxID=1046114 RepID=A0ABZ2HVR8_9HYPH